MAGACAPRMMMLQTANDTATHRATGQTSSRVSIITGARTRSGSHMLSLVKGGVRIAVRVVTRAARAGIAGMRDGDLLVRLNAPPVEGAANAELIEVIANALGVSKRSVSIAAGEQSRRKIVHVSGVSVDEVQSKLPSAG